MIRDGFVTCDHCGVYMGQLWNQPAAARDLLPLTDFRLCHHCNFRFCPDFTVQRIPAPPLIQAAG